MTRAIATAWRWAAAVLVALVLAVVLPTMTAQAASISRYVGWKCWNDLALWQNTNPGACVWMNVDHTNDRIRLYAQATGQYLQTDVAVRYLRLQRQGGDLAWRDVSGTMVNDLDGWNNEVDDIAGPLWACNPTGGNLRALVQFSIRQWGSGQVTTTTVWTGTYTYYGYEC